MFPLKSSEIGGGVFKLTKSVKIFKIHQILFLIKTFPISPQYFRGGGNFCFDPTYSLYSKFDIFKMDLEELIIIMN